MLGRCVRAMVLVGVLVGALASTAWPVGATPASDPLGCSAAVYDPTGVTTAALTAAVTADAVSLQADLHVRIEPNLDGDIDSRERQLETQCAGWLGSNGLREPNLLVISVAPTEHQTLIAYGNTFESALVGTAPSIQSDVMNPKFKTGDIEAGLLAGLDAVVATIGGSATPLTSTPIDANNPLSTIDFKGLLAGTTVTPATPYVPPAEPGTPWGGIFAMIALIIAIAVIGAVARRWGWMPANSGSRYRRWTAGSRFSSWSSGSSSGFSSGGGSGFSGGSSGGGSSGGGGGGGGSSSSSW